MRNPRTLPVRSDRSPRRPSYRPRLEAVERRLLLAFSGATGSFLLTAVEGQAMSSQTVATFTVDDGSTNPSQFSATINWGDGHVTSGSITYDSLSGAFTVTGANNPNYAEEGSFNVTVNLTETPLSGPTSTTSVTDTASVSDAPLNSGSTSFLTATEGKPLAPAGQVVQLGSFTDSDPNGVLGEYQVVSIDWGDGTPLDTTTGTITQPSGSGYPFVVSGNHTYAEQGNYATRITVRDVEDVNNPASGTRSQVVLTLGEGANVTVSDANLNAGRTVAISATAGTSVSSTVANFTDSDPGGMANDYKATIVWGDGSSTDSNTLITPDGKGGFNVHGSHIYSTSGNYVVTTSVFDVSGGRTTTDPTDATVTIVSSATVAPAASSVPGSFTVTNNTDGGPGSLRQALLDSNVTPSDTSPNSINFNIAVGSVAEKALPSVGSFPTEIVQGPDGNLWFTEFGANRIGRLTPSGVLTEFPIPTSGSGPYGITSGPDGNLWFTEFNSGYIGRITPSGTITEFSDSILGGGGPDIITSGPDGALWFTESNLNRIDRITTAGAISTFNIPTGGSSPYGIVSGPDGALWFTEQAGNQIGRITTSGAITEFPVPTANSSPFGITSGPNGNLWFTEQTGNKIGQITTTGTITELAIPTASSVPAEISTGSDGNLWFSEENANQVARLTTAGTFTEFPLPSIEAVPIGLTNGPDGNLWIAEAGAGKIGRLTVNAGLTITPATELPAITTPATVNGYSQPGASQNTLAVGDNAKILITLSGINAPTSPTPANGLILGFNSTVEGLAINSFPGAGVVLNSSGGSVLGNFVGTDTTGTIAGPNAGGGVEVTFAGETIGGSAAADRNVISGNGTAGIVANDEGLPATLIQGNYIGTNASGTAALPNANGITLTASSIDSSTGEGESIIGNLISGNTFIGLVITGASPSVQNVVVQGNLIGTNATGTGALGNGTIGLLMLDNVINSTIGGTTTGQGNTISFNGTEGISIQPSVSASSTNLNNTITGNTINSNRGNGVGINNGTNTTISGNTIDSNGGSGVSVNAGNTISGNTVSLNTFDGIQVLSFGSSFSSTQSNAINGNTVNSNGTNGISITDGVTNTVNGNTVNSNGGLGVVVTVTGASNTLSGNTINSNSGNGVFLTDGASNSISGNTVNSNGGIGVGLSVNSGASNTISGNTIDSNTLDGIHVAPSGAASSITVTSSITNNTVSTNGGSGVAILNASGNSITSNTILSNHTDGVLVQGGTGNPILSNSIDLSGNLGIELTNGGNNNQPFPTLTSVTSTGTTTTITGTLHAAANTSYVIQFFSSPAPNASGFGEGRTFLGQTNVLTDGAGDATINTTLSATVAADQYITATATDLYANNTSQFSEDTADLAMTGTATPPGLEEGYNVTYSFTVTNNGPSPAASATLVDTLPTTVNFVSATGGATPVGGKVTIPLGTLDRGASATVTVVVQLAATGTISNTATTSSATADPVAGNSSVTVNYTVPHQFTVTNTNNTGLGSLNQAILFTNQDTGFTGQDLILFNIPGTGPHTISPTTALPAITHAAIINGYTQPGSSTNTQTNGDNAVLQVVINGAGAGANADGLDLNADAIAVLGLVIQNFQGAGLGVNASNEAIGGDFLGTDATGSTAQPNGVGVRLSLGSGNSLIGGALPAQRNLISGNANDGIDLLGASQSVQNTQILGNLIGTNAAGTGALGNGGYGVLLSDQVPNTTIGGATSGQGNVISFNGSDGIRIQATQSFDTPLVLNTAITGNTIDSNGGNGVAVLAGSGNDVTGDTILGNKADGVLVQGAVNNPILNNSIDQSGNLGIELKNGGNNNQPAPVLTSTTRTPGSITIHGTLHAVPYSSYRIQFFSSPALNAAGHSEGRTFLGQTNVTTDTAGNATINTTFTHIVTGNQYITATATDTNNNTSQFSENTADLAVTGTATPQGLEEGYTLTYSFTVTNNGPSPAPGATLVDTLPAKLQFLSTTGGATSRNGQQITISLGTIDSGASATATIVVRLAGTGTISNTASVSSDFTDTTPGNNTVTVTYVVPHRFTVTNTNNSGLGSLEQAIVFTNNENKAPNNFTGQDLIVFNIPGAGTHTISPTKALPLDPITHPVFINGFTQPGAVRGSAVVGNNSVLPIVINGANAEAGVSGLEVSGGASFIAGLVINGFSGSGITLDTYGGDIVAGNIIGTDPTGTVPVGNRVDGVQVAGTQGNRVGIPGLGNLIAGNQVGVYLFNGASNNAVQSNMLGSLSGGQLKGNSSGGVLLGNANRNLIGGSFPVQGNIIAGNPAYSGLVLFLGSTGNIAAWNTIAGNGQDGVFILNSPGNRIGIPAGPNTIAGNGFNGVDLEGAASTGNMIQFNRIVQNGLNGVYSFNAPGNLVGGTGGLGNVITGSGFSGVEIEGAGATGNTLQGNTILGSKAYGVLLFNSTRNTVGGAGTASNTIQNNAFGGIQVIIGGFPPSNVTGGNIILANNAQKTGLTTGNLAATNTMATRVRTVAASSTVQTPSASVRAASVPRTRGGLLAALLRKRRGH